MAARCFATICVLVAGLNAQVPLSWSQLGAVSGAAHLSGPINAAVGFDDGTGPALYVGGGQLQAMSGLPAGPVARWDGQTWSTIGTTVQANVNRLEVLDDGTGPALYAASDWGLYRWDGLAWSVAQSGNLQSVRVVAAADVGSGPELFTYARLYSGAPYSINRLIGAIWLALPAIPLGAWSIDHVYDLLAFDDGSGPALWVAGRISTPHPWGSYYQDHMRAFVARWDGTAWTVLPHLYIPVTNPMASESGWVRDLEVLTTGGVSELYAGGRFEIVCTGSPCNLARWSGGAWVAAGNYNPNVWAMTVYDDGSGPALLVGGGTPYVGQGILNLGSTQSFVGMYGSPQVLRTFDDGGGHRLVTMGYISSQGAPFQRELHVSSCCLESRVGASVGARTRVLAASASGGAPESPVTYAAPLNQPFDFHVLQPNVTMTPAAFLLVGYVGIPDAGTVTPTPLGDIGVLIPGVSPAAFWLASSPAVVPALATSTLAPWTWMLPGVPIPLTLTIQGVIQDDSAPAALAITNALVLRFGP